MTDDGVTRGGGADSGVAIGGLVTPVGRLSVAVSGIGLVAVRWGDIPAATRWPVVDDPDRLRPALDQLTAYFAGRLRTFTLPLDLSGLGRSPRLVLQTLFEQVGFGTSITYGQLAHRSGTGVPARGIGAIMGANPIPIVVPCHRVLAANGLGGYSGGRSGEGLATKRWLLTMEGVLQPTLDWASAT
ncbi:methylated-DNA-[protein]-cysteine S-methyltransferase [Nakamurella panacisegetis]|uniref:Methylated-DNA--protein-cysteine methyltransferase n=1 Tax=Nakamurella panacisegetis TaxID=1090615 RepID=A0A1H0M0M7_9ACTN|nr:methylated-DNA--[protein]-cysteine S-methyltransferase [Nakamurella panacisegetis]SDO73894.1 methylated-DNA-[protein]-cysteine S-methyltransferase [Nakamurella panacisegetis]